ncbi:MAG: hypothetical protein ACE5E5_08355 [Phycisphaerae bacterium]
MRLCAATRGWGSLLLCLGALGFGCKDKPPLPSHLTDLGDGDRVLVLGRAAWHPVPYKRNDTADWVEFREPGSDDASGGDDATSDDDIKAEIRAFIKEYNEVAADEDFEELRLYHVASQQEILGPMFEGAKTILAKLKAMEAALNQKLPDKKDAIEATFAMLREGSSGTLVVTGLEVVSRTEVTGQMPPPFGHCRFLLVDDEWTLEVANLPDPVAMKSQIEMAGAMFDSLIQGLETGAMPPETVLTQIKTMATMAKGMQGGSETEAAEPSADDNEN